MKKLIAYALLALSLAGLTGCAGIFNGKTQVIQIESNVKGATIELITKEGKIIPIGETPYTGPIPRTKNSILVLKKTGYAEKRHVLETKLSLVFFLNGFGSYFSTFSTTTDMTNETAWEYTPTNLYINMEPASSSIDSRKSDFQKDTDIKRFVMMNYADLVNDLARSKGEHLDALVLEHFKAEPARYNEITRELRKLLQESKHDVARFGEKVSAYYFAS
jgi:hypothetical protein